MFNSKTKNETVWNDLFNLLKKQNKNIQKIQNGQTVQPTQTQTYFPILFLKISWPTNCKILLTQF